MLLAPPLPLPTTLTFTCSPSRFALLVCAWVHAYDATQNLALRNELVACKAAVASLEFDKEQLRLRLRAADRSAAGPDAGSPVQASQPPGFADKFKRSMGQATRSVGGLFAKQPSKPKRTIADIMAPAHDDAPASPQNSQHGRRRQVQSTAADSPTPSPSGGDPSVKTSVPETAERSGSVAQVGVVTPRKSGAGQGTSPELGKSRTLVRDDVSEPWGLDVDSSVDNEGVWVHLVFEVQRGSPASRSGVSAGDAIIVVDGRDALRSDHAQLVSVFQERRKEIVIRVCPCDDLLSTLQQPMLTLL